MDGESAKPSGELLSLARRAHTSSPGSSTLPIPACNPTGSQIRIRHPSPYEARALPRGRGDAPGMSAPVQPSRGVGNNTRAIEATTPESKRGLCLLLNALPILGTAKSKCLNLEANMLRNGARAAPRHVILWMQYLPRCMRSCVWSLLAEAPVQSLPGELLCQARPATSSDPNCMDAASSCNPLPLQPSPTSGLTKSSPQRKLRFVSDHAHTSKKFGIG